MADIRVNCCVRTRNGNLPPSPLLSETFHGVRVTFVPPKRDAVRVRVWKVVWEEKGHEAVVSCTLGKTDAITAGVPCLYRSRQFLLTQKRLRGGGLTPGGQSALPRTQKCPGLYRSRQFLLAQKRLRGGGLTPGGQSALPRTQKCPRLFISLTAVFANAKTPPRGRASARRPSALPRTLCVLGV